VAAEARMLDSAERDRMSLCHGCATDEVEKRPFPPLLSFVVTSGLCRGRRRKCVKGKDLNHKSLPFLMVRPEGLEPTTRGLRIRCSTVPRHCCVTTNGDASQASNTISNRFQGKRGRFSAPPGHTPAQENTP